MQLSRVRTAVAAVLVALALAAAGAAHAVTLPFKAGAGQGLFLHLSDIHFDPFADPKLVPQLIAAPVDTWESIFRSSADQRFSPRGHDTNYRLLASALEAAQGLPYDYVINTGDELAHDFKGKFFDAVGGKGDYEAFLVKTLRFVDLMLTKSFPKAPLITTLGNNDAVCGDYRVAPDSTMLAHLGQDLPVVSGDPQALRDFKIGGYYRVPHPTVPGRDIIVLNSIFWSYKYEDLCGRKGGDPGAQELAWFARTLAQEEAAGRTATLVMHIPPGVNGYMSRHTCDPQAHFWNDRYTSRFLALVRGHADVLRDGYAGHTHMDNFRVLSDADGTPFMTLRITPSISPIFGNNPAFTVLLYDKSDATVKDYATFDLANLDQAGSAPADWQHEYDFAQTYGAPAYTPAALAALAQRLHTDSAARTSYINYYAAGSTTTPINGGNWKAFACTQTALTSAAYAACACPGDTGPQAAPAAPH